MNQLSTKRGGGSRIRGAIALTMLLCIEAAVSEEAIRKPASAYRLGGDGRLEFPADYREWIFLSAGRGMSYGPSAKPDGPPVFDNVFVHPAAYREFLKTGRWPDRAIFVLEIRKAVTEGSINRGGQFQKEVVGVEVEIKDQRFKDTGGWGFFEFDSDHTPAAKIEKSASCYTCHVAHGAVEQTFVQFYPTLIPVAEKHHTLRKQP